MLCRRSESEPVEEQQEGVLPQVRAGAGGCGGGGGVGRIPSLPSATHATMGGVAASGATGEEALGYGLLCWGVVVVRVGAEGVGLGVQRSLWSVGKTALDEGSAAEDPGATTRGSPGGSGGGGPSDSGGGVAVLLQAGTRAGDAGVENGAGDGRRALSHGRREEDGEVVWWWAAGGNRPPGVGVQEADVEGLLMPRVVAGVEYRVTRPRLPLPLPLFWCLRRALGDGGAKSVQEVEEGKVPVLPLRCSCVAVAVTIKS